MEVVQAIQRGERVAARAVWAELRQRFGALRALGVLLRVAWQKIRGAPFAALGAAKDERDRLSRRQCGDLILLDRAVRSVSDEETALAVARAAVLAGGVPFLDAMLPDVEAERLSELAPVLAGSFFNAEGKASLQEDGFAFEVHRCRFVELLRAADASHLGPLFCEADNVFFDGVRRPITLRRSKTIATGAKLCDFQFSARKADGD